MVDQIYVIVKARCAGILVMSLNYIFKLFNTPTNIRYILIYFYS